MNSLIAKDKIRWKTLEYEHRKKNPDWFWSFGIITASIIIAGIMLDNSLFSVAIGIAAFLVIVYSFRKPLEISCEVNRSGVIVNKILYPYASLTSFWVEENELHPKILFVSKKKLMPLVVLTLASDIPPQSFRDFLDPFLPQVEIHEPVSQKILEHLGI